MQNFTIVTMSASDFSVSRLCLDQLKMEIKKNNDTIDVVDIRDLPPMWANNQGLEKAPLEYQELSKKLKKSNGIYFLVPIYCYSASSAMKLISELYIDELRRKPVAFITAAGSLRSHQAISAMMNSMVLEQETFCFPKSVQLTQNDLDDNNRPSAELRERLDTLVYEFGHFSEAIAQFNEKTKS